MRTATLLALLLAFPLAATAQERPRRLKHEISIDVEDMKLERLVQQISRQTGKTILVDPEVDERVTLNLRRVSWPVAVDVVARLTGCKVKRLSSSVLLLTQPPRVSLQFTDANVRTVMLLLARYGGKSIVIGPEVQGTVTVDLRDVEWVPAMRAVVQLAGDYVVLGAGSDMVQVGSGRGAAEAEADPKVSTLEGRVEKKGGAELTIAVEGGDEVTCRLAEDGDRGRRLRAVVAKVRKGDRIVATCESVAGQRVITNVIVRGR